MTDRPHYIEDMTREIAEFRGDFNSHTQEDKEWKRNHEKMDTKAFSEIQDGLKLLSDNLEAYKKSNEAMVNTWRTLPLIQKFALYVAGLIVGVASVGAAIKTILSWIR